MAAKQLTKLEQMGILVGIIVIAMFAYLKFVNQDPGRKLKRTEKEWAKISSEINRLKAEAGTGSVKRAVSRLRNKVSSARRELEKVEVWLAEESETDEIANEIVQIAAERRLMIKEFEQITDKRAIEEISNGEKVYNCKYYKITLKGRFGSLRVFLEKINELKINDFPKLIALRKIAIEKLEEEKFMQAELWLSI